MLLTYTYVQGKEQLTKLLTKMGKDAHPKFCESFAHVDNITIERIEERVNNDGPYRDFFILYMPHPNGTSHMSDARHEVHVDIRSGAKKLRKV